jgi:Tfp pilus assembly protein PilV
MAGRITNMKTQGFSLIESLVTIVFLGGALSGVIYLHGKLTLETLHSQSEATAVALASDKIAETRALSYAYIAIEDDKSDTNTVDNVAFTRSWTTTEYASPNYKIIKVTVSWTDAQGNTQSINLASIIAEVNQADAYL